MRYVSAVFLAVFLLAVLEAVASAAEIKIRIVDPQGAVVAGAQVSLVSADGSRVLDTQTSSAEGLATLRTSAKGPYEITVLAPGFAKETATAKESGDISVALHIAAAAETVVVSGTRTPVPSEAAGAEVDALSAEELTTMQPIAMDDAVRFLPGVVVNTAGQRGGISSLFVRGGESTYNKVIVDGVPVDNPGDTFDFGTLPLAEADRVEFVRGAQSTLYGSDAMTSVLQVWTRTGSTQVPELRFGADGGNFDTASGYASLAGARGRYDYNVFGREFYTGGLGVNDSSSNSLEGANVGIAFTDRVGLRVRVRHLDSATGVPGEWNFNGSPVIVSGAQVLVPDPSESSHLNNLLGSTELTISGPTGWQHRLTGYDSLYRYIDTNLNSNPASYSSYADSYGTHVNRLGFDYQADYQERTWAHTTFGYRVENEAGVTSDQNSPPSAFGQRMDQDVYLQQQLRLGRLEAIGGGRFVHSSAYGNIGSPRVALSLEALRGDGVFSGTRLRFSYADGFMEPALYETFGHASYGEIPNPGLLPERTRAFEAGFQQKMFRGLWDLDATYFNNLFHDQIQGNQTPEGYQFFNLTKSFAQGAEFVIHGRLRSNLAVAAGYSNLSTQVLENPLCTAATPCSPFFTPGNPLLRRPKQSATFLLSHLGRKWGGNLGGSFVGPRPDSDFDGLGINHAAGYVRADLGGWYAVHSRVTIYMNVQNALDRRYNEVVGYPALPVNFRAGMRVRIGGE